MKGALSFDGLDVLALKNRIQVQFAVELTIKPSIKNLIMKNSFLSEKSSDEIAQINVALFQLAARIENRPPTIPTPFADLMLDKNKLEAVLNTVENEEPDYSKPDMDVPYHYESKNAAPMNNGTGSLPGFSRPQLIKAEFHLDAPAACSVKLAADFTDWEKHPLDMIKSEDGVWFTMVPLLPGQYPYRFIVDGQWRDDPRPARRVPNQFGTINAVVEVN